MPDRVDPQVEHTQRQAARWVEYLTGSEPQMNIPYGLLTGPSAGFAWALGATDTTFGGITGDLTVAATGAISPFGLVSPVGSVDVKTAAANLAGIDVVFVPLGNAGDAERPEVVIDEWDQFAAIDLALAAGAEWDGEPVAVATQHVAAAVAWLCGATAEPGACAALDALLAAPNLKPAPE